MLRSGQFATRPWATNVAQGHEHERGMSVGEVTLQAMLDEIKGRGLGAANWLERAKKNEFRATPEAIESKERSLVILRAIHENLKRQMVETT